MVVKHIVGKMKIVFLTNSIQELLHDPFPPKFISVMSRNMTSWWREEWSDLPATFSIHDFVLSTNMVQETIKRTLELAGASVH